jgi:hypothetical protein
MRSLVDSLDKKDYPTLLASHFSNFYHPFPKKALESIPLRGLFVYNKYQKTNFLV